jgi:hypothetical protein
MKTKRTNRRGAKVAEENGEEEWNNETSEIDEMKSIRAEGPSTFDGLVCFVVPALLLPFAPLFATSAPRRFVPLEVKQP